MKQLGDSLTLISSHSGKIYVNDTVKNLIVPIQNNQRVILPPSVIDVT